MRVVLAWLRLDLRRRWRSLAVLAPVAVWTLLLVAPAALLLSNLLAAWPGHRAARLHIANVLRAE